MREKGFLHEGERVSSRGRKGFFTREKGFLHEGKRVSSRGKKVLHEGKRVSHVFMC